MRIKNIRLKNYKRFTELTIADVPATARLVVLVGPNGTGKSSVFDSFLLKASAAVDNYRLSGNTEQYYEKVLQSQTTMRSRAASGLSSMTPVRAQWTGGLRSRCDRRTGTSRLPHRALAGDEAGRCRAPPGSDH